MQSDKGHTAQCVKTFHAERCILSLQNGLRKVRVRVGSWGESLTPHYMKELFISKSSTGNST